MRGLALIVFAFLATFSIIMARKQVPGGFGDEMPADKDIQDLVDQMKDQIERETSCKITRLKALSYVQRIAAGPVYAVKVSYDTETCGSGKTMHVHIWRRLPFEKEPQVILLKNNVGEHDPIVEHK